MNCLHCGAELFQGRNSFGKYCNNSCQGAHKRNIAIEAWLSGELVGWKGQNRLLKPFVRFYLHNTRGTACEVCGWDERHPIDGAILTEVDHIDGDAENCKPDNLKILCPNCHAMTPTFRRRNKVSKRSRS